MRPLNNAVKDAQCVKEKLEKLQNVDVIYAENCDSDELNSKADEFVELTKELDGAILFYAGHACEYNSSNRLMATDCGRKGSDIRNHSLSVLSLLCRLAM